MSDLPAAQSQSYQGAMGYSDASSEFNTLAFIASQAIGKLWTAIPVLVKKSTNSGDPVKPGTVDVQPIVNQIDGQGNATAHGTIYGLPVIRLRAGRSAVIMDPVEGDIGVAIFCSRDISSAIKNEDVANPGSRRRYDPADGLYLGGLVGADPTQYVTFNDDGITVVSPDQVTIQAPDITLDGDVSVTGSLTASDDVVGNGISLDSHVHGGVQTGAGNTAGPH